MKLNEVFCNTFKAIGHELGFDRPKDQLGQVYDGKIMYYRTDCHRDHQRHPNWVSNLLGQTIYLSPLLEQQAAKEQKTAKIDLVDFIMKPPNDPNKPCIHTVWGLQTTCLGLANDPN